ncbi:MAG TPA: BON domain-containing protein [Gemmataceae bacterium]|nr:BON domain-containing protein [Gemmataceae bacterium]
MKRGQTSRAGLLVRATLAGVALALWCSPLLAQGGGGGAGGGGAAGGGASAGGSGTSSGSTAGSSSLFGSAGTGSSGVTSTSSGGTSPINKNNSFNAYYSNPLAAGYGPNVTLKPANSVNVAGSDTMANTRVTGKGLFGVAMIASTTTSGTTGKGGAAGGTGGTGSTSSTNAYASTMGVKRAPSYYTVVGPTFGNVRPVQPMQIQGELQTTLRDSSFLTSGKNLNVSVTDNQVVVLTGVVATAEEKQLAESLVRMTPNVYFVRNEITVAGGNQIEQGPAAVPAVRK